MITLEERNGYLYIVSSDPDFDIPMLRRLWYPIGVRAAEEGVSRIKYRLIEGGATLPEFNETEPILPPKTRVPTRWRYGRWEKYLKHKGPAIRRAIYFLDYIPRPYRSRHIGHIKPPAGYMCKYKDTPDQGPKARTFHTFGSGTAAGQKRDFNR